MIIYIVAFSPYIDIQVELGGGVGVGDQLTGVAAVVASQQNQALRKIPSIILNERVLIVSSLRRVPAGVCQSWLL